MPSRLNPYLNFQGNAREAMDFYRSVFGGELTLMTFGENGMAQDPGDADKIMHSQLDVANGMTLMAADTPSGVPSQGLAGVSISLSGDDDAELSGYYQKLSEGGTVVEPLVTAPWGDKFGMVTDRYGVLWLVNISQAPQA